MRIFVHEHLTASGVSGGGPNASLAREGKAMLDAVCDDLAAIPGVTVATSCQDRASFDELARSSDGTLLIAPELDRELERLARRTLAAGGRLLGPGPDAIEAASDKLLLARRLEELRIPCLPTLDARDAGLAVYPAVVKPRFGAGSVGVRLARGPEEVARVAGGTIITPLVSGLPTSVLAIAGPRGVLPLRAGAQLLSEDGLFTYLGGRIPLPPRLETRARRLAVRAIQAVPGLIGFVGVDLLLDRENPREPSDRVVEINARLTTSYVGLRALAESNLAEHWLRAIHGEFPAEPMWKEASMRFHPDGSLEPGEAIR